METNFSVSPSACLSLLNTRRVCRAIAHPPPLVRLLMDTLEESVNSHRNASLDIFIITFFSPAIISYNGTTTYSCPLSTLDFQKNQTSKSN